MTDRDRLEQRLAAVERVVVDGDVALDELAELASVADAVSTIETRLSEHERRLAELEGAVQSIEGYVGNVEAVNDEVERQSATAVATVDRLERRVEALEVELDDLEGGLLAGEDPAVDTAGSVTGGETETSGETGPESRAGDGEGRQFGTAVDGGDGGDGDDDGGSGNRPAGESPPGSPEQSVAAVLGDGKRSLVDDGIDRPASSANQTAIELAVGEENDRRENGGDAPTGTDDGATGTAPDTATVETTAGSGTATATATATDTATAARANSETDDSPDDDPNGDDTTGLVDSIRSRLS
ncbi:DUF7310 family coiled-coil domain-containing protein [Natrialba asiatica]|uniref:DUF7310 domain-containing protein n=1 Tax=Natrialba asiatica (strain ATCC 700177 / DSM 12278 / JCM 9576 / FERM P-10747 / NBRC 102637 / 172P1) TaxID=29540 RepID=M0B792_NATA1|nr:hypothetical protein [Natrialba asiatica]ELZ06133.1 hypothetical protein C481_01335 [Natrialba asiatica DSM 12278]